MLCSLGLGWSGGSSPCLCLPGQLQEDEDRKSQAVTRGVVMGPHHPLPSWEELCKATGVMGILEVCLGLWKGLIQSFC